jgi:hypothetical protein
MGWRVLLSSLGCTFIGLGMTGSVAHAGDLPTPRLIPELSLSKDKGVESAPSEDSWENRKKTISLVGGAPGSPTGVAGFSFEYAPIKYLVLGAGGGWAPDSGPGGPRGAFMPRVRLPLNRWFAIGMGTPLALGPYQFTAQQVEQCEFAGCSTGYRTTRTWTMAVWGHIEPNIEFRVGPGVALRLYAGYGRLLNTESDQCRSTLPNGCPSNIGEQKWYGGLALGYAW